MNFYVVTSQKSFSTEDSLYLVENNWDDWFQYSTVYIVFYKDKCGENHEIGAVKIGQRDQKERRPKLPSHFTELDKKFFSLGTSDDYYDSLNKISEKYDLRETILNSLRDIAKDLDLFDDVISYDVTKTSLLRDKTISMIKGQYHRISEGGARLTDYRFSYSPYNSELDDSSIKLEFEVVPEQIPPTNIHVLIGKNGVGKTTILKNILLSVESDDDDYQYGKVKMDWFNSFTESFSNIVFVSFSAFDNSISVPVQKLPFLHIGLIKDNKIKNFDDLLIDFSDSLYLISKGNKNKVWKDSISILESDSTFNDLNIKNWSNVQFDKHKFDELKTKIPKKVGEGDRFYRERMEKIIFKNNISSKFNALSSGHKVILLTMAKLVETVEEKTLVLLDEPEEHLHPPLVSAFIRALSNLLIYRNGVGIIATHSPVIVQEIPKKCVWILRRSGDELTANRPHIETFGENLGILTSEVFGFEVTNSGFHKILRDMAEKKKNYKSALKVFKGELGEEGKTVLRSLVYDQEESEGDSFD